MRITSQMLNMNAQKMGLVSNQVSLLDFLNKKNSFSSITQLYGKYGSVSSQTGAGYAFYEKLEKSSYTLSSSASVFTNQKNNIFDKAREKESSEDIYKNTEEMVDSYNKTISTLKGDSSSLNQYYYQMLKASAANNGDRLKSIGITVGKDGSMKLDRKKFNEADIDTLESVLGNSTFSKQLSFVSSRIHANADSAAGSVTSRYSSRGSMLTSGYTSRYDYRK